MACAFIQNLPTLDRPLPNERGVMKYFLLLIMLCGAPVAPHAQSTAFTYQGRLAANGAPYTGFAEMQFALFSAPTGGTPIAASTPATARVNVSGGLFATSLDFGAAAFPGSDRFLEIQVRTNIGAFTTLTPRQPLTPTPYALYARAAGTAGPWSSTASNAFYNSGNVGIGTATPAAGLHVKKEATPPGGTLALEGNTLAAMTFFPNGVAAGRKGYFGFATATPDITVANENPNGRIVLASPNSTVFATGGEENLRIVRGSFLLGALDTGSGFAVAHLTDFPGHYRITFNTPFASRPSVTVTCDFDPAFADVALYAVVNEVTAASSAEIILVRHTGERFDGSFHFIAVGPR